MAVAARAMIPSGGDTSWDCPPIGGWTSQMSMPHDGTGGGLMLKAGDAAPSFEARDHEGRTVKLDDLRGKRVVLWFYPKADTPG